MEEKKLVLDKSSLVNEAWMDSVMSGDPNGRVSGLSSHPDMGVVASGAISIVATTPRRPLPTSTFHHVTLGEDEPGESQDFDDLIQALRGEGEMNLAMDGGTSEVASDEGSDVARGGGGTMTSRKSVRSARQPIHTSVPNSGASTPPELADMEAGYGEMRRISMADTHL